MAQSLLEGLDENAVDFRATYDGEEEEPVVLPTGFPNLFFPGGPHAAAGNNPRYNGDQVDFVTDLLVYARNQGYDVIEVDPAAEEAWDAMIERNVARQSFTEKSYYFGTNVPGKPRRFLLNSGGRPKLHKEIAKIKASDFKAFRMARGSTSSS